MYNVGKKTNTGVTGTIITCEITWKDSDKVTFG